MKVGRQADAEEQQFSMCYPTNDKQWRRCTDEKLLDSLEVEGHWGRAGYVKVLDCKGPLDGLCNTSYLSYSGALVDLLRYASL